MAQSVGERLAQCRRILSVMLWRDVRQDEMAEITGFSPAVWSHWETGRRRPSRETVSTLVRRLRALGLAWLTEPWLDYNEGEGPPMIGGPPKTKREVREGGAGEFHPKPSASKRKGGAG